MDTITPWIPLLSAIAAIATAWGVMRAGLSHHGAQIERIMHEMEAIRSAAYIRRAEVFAGNGEAVFTTRSDCTRHSDIICAKIRDLKRQLEDMDRKRDEARAELDRLRAQIERLMGRLERTA